MVKTIHSSSGVYRVAWPGCRLWRLQPSWARKDCHEGAAVMEIGRWFQSDTVLGKKELNRTGWCICSWYRHCAPLALESEWWIKFVYNVVVNVVSQVVYVSLLHCSRLANDNFLSMGVMLQVDLSVQLINMYLSCLALDFVQLLNVFLFMRIPHCQNKDGMGGRLYYIYRDLPSPPPTPPPPHTHTISDST